MMARTATFAAGAFSLFLVAMSGQARAGSAADKADAAPGVLRLFGKAVCLSNAPEDAVCDWRWPVPDARARRDGEATGYALTLFGDRYCFGVVHDGPCDHTFPARSSARAEPRTLRWLGLTFCLGGEPGGGTCDLMLPALPEKSERRASL